ncbi:MAG: hypothetical protein HOO91_21355 [Bacteroidales bacterium]|nr:hypothetical protein [Bacteroidales bacterium]
MTDLERIHFIEETFGFKLHQVPIEKLATQNKFYTIPLFYISISEIDHVEYFFKGTRNYSINKESNVTGLALNFLSLSLLPDNFISEFQHLKELQLRNMSLNDISFIQEFKELTMLDLSNNEQIRDYSFLKKLKNLTVLDLRGNNLKDVSFLSELEGLKALYLSDSKILDYSFLKKFKKLSILCLRGNMLSDISFLKDLKELDTLYLTNNSQIKDYSFLKELKKLTKIYLNANDLTEISFLKELKWLTDIDLCNNKLSDISPLIEIDSLNSLYLGKNNLNNVSFLRKLKGLSGLNLNFNKQIDDYSFLRDLEHLNFLDLKGNNLSDIRLLKGFKKLTALDLSFNNLKDVSFLKENKDLSMLYLRGNKLNDISFLKEFKGLTILSLSSNNLGDISFLRDHKKLISLDLSNNHLNDVSFLKDNRGITSLDLSNNHLKDISFLKDNTEITSLSLGNNDLSDVSFLKELKGITSLDLRNNNLSDVSFLKELKGITSLYLSENPIIIPPKEIVDGGIEAIHEYFRQAEKYETEKAYEAKVLIVGEPGAGKTTLMELLFNPKHPVPSPENSQPSTLGVEIKPNRSFKHPLEGLPEIKAHIWDFGGQDIQYMLHQYFLTDDSVYILLTDGRSGNTRYEYWFHIIGLLGKNSPILVLLNRHKGQETVVPFDAKLYKETFPNLKILDFGEINFGNLNHRWDNLINELADNLSKLPIVGQQTLKPWRPIREEIEKLQPKKHITLDEFEEICYQNGLEEAKEVRFLLDYFHKIGFVVNYNDETLQNTVFLDPNWIIHAIYDALSDSIIIDGNGQFHKDHLYDHWQKKVCDKKHKLAYTRTECNYLLNLMLKNRFEVCYPLESKPGYYIVPLKLPDRRPDYDFETSNSLRFRYQYPFMPEGLLSRLIVRMHEYIEEGKVWLTGALFREAGCIAEVLQHETTQEGIKYIGIRINGTELHKRQRFLRDIRREVEHIHRSTFPYIKFSEMVVCNCPVCEKHQTPNYYAYEDLQTYLEARERDIFCTIGKQRVDIRQMIDEVFLPEDFDRDGQKKPIEPKFEIKKKTIKIFLASSSELSEDRREFEIFISRKKDEYESKGISLKLILWENFIDAMSATRLQDEYNKAIAVCDIFVSLFHTKVGKYTNEEFEVALESFKAKGKPLIYTYFSKATIDPTELKHEFTTLLNFREKLDKLGHFPTTYKNIDDFKNQFGEQLVKVMDRL